MESSRSASGRPLQLQVLRVQPRHPEVEPREALGQEAGQEDPVVGILLDQVHEVLFGDPDEDALSLGDDRGGAAVREQEGHLPQEDVVRGQGRDQLALRVDVQEPRDDVVEVVRLLALGADVLPVLEAELRRGDEDPRDDVALVLLMLDLEGDLVPGLVVPHVLDIEPGHDHAHPVQARLVGLGGDAGLPVEALALVPDGEPRTVRGDSVGKEDLPRADVGILVLGPNQVHDVPVLLQPGRLLVVADLAVPVLDRVDQELQKGHVELFLEVPVDQVGVVQVVRDQVRVGRDVQGIVVDHEGSRDVLDQVLLDAPLEEDLLVLADDLEEPRESRQELPLFQDRDDVLVLHGLLELLLVLVVVDGHDSAVVEPGVRLNLRQEARDVHLGVGEIEDLDVRQLVLEEFDHRLGVFEKLREEIPSEPGALLLDEVVELFVAGYHRNFSHGPFLAIDGISFPVSALEAFGLTRFRRAV